VLGRSSSQRERALWIRQHPSFVDNYLAHPFPRAAFPRRALLCALTVFASLAAAAVLAASSPAAPEITGDFSWSPAAPLAGDTVTFTASVTPSDGAEITKYRWDLDGAGGFEVDSGTSPTAERTYGSASDLRVRLQVRDSAGKTRTFRHHLSVTGPPGHAGQAPVASFTIAPAAPVAGQPVTFTSTSSDPDGTIADQVWDLNGDGSFDNGGGASAARTFPSPGEYVVGLRVVDNDGLVSFDSQTLTVGSAPGTPPVATQQFGPRLLSPFPVVRIAGRITRFGTRVRLLRVAAPVGAKVSVRCNGRGCPFKKQVRAATSPKLRAAVNLRVRRLERLLPPGLTVRVYVTKKGAIGKYTKFRFRRGKPPVRVDRCLLPGSWAPSQCPGT
jgi:plastocyanin